MFSLSRLSLGGLSRANSIAEVGPDAPDPEAATFATDHGWTQGISSRAVARQWYTYFGGTTGTATPAQRVVKVHNQSGRVAEDVQINTGYIRDDHNTVAIAFTPSGKLLTAYTGHGEDAVLGFRKSTDDTLANLAAEVNIAAGSTATDLTYCMLFALDEDTYFAFTQENNQTWLTFKTTDGGATWVQKKAITSTSAYAQYYLGAPTGIVDSTVYFFAYPHMVNQRNGCRAFEVNLATGDLTAGGASLGNLDDGTPGTAIVTYDNLPLVYTPTNPLRSVNVQDQNAAGTMVVLAETGASDGSDGRYVLGRMTGVNRYDPDNWTFTYVANTGAIFGNTQTTPGISLARESHSGIRLYISRFVDPNWFIERLDSSDNGATFSRTTIESGTTKAGRLITPISAKSILPVAWLRGTYSTFTSYNQNLHWSSTGGAAGDGGALLTGSEPDPDPELGPFHSNLQVRLALTEGVGSGAIVAPDTSKNGWDASMNIDGVAGTEPNWTATGIANPGTNDGMTIRHRPILDATTFTVLAAIRVPNLTSARAICARDNGDGPRSWFFRVTLTTGHLHYAPIGGTGLEGSGVVPTNEWMIVELVVNGTNAAIRLNEAAYASGTVSLPPTTVAPLYVAARRNAGTGNWSMADMGYFSYYNSVLSGADLTAAIDDLKTIMAAKGVNL